MRLQELRIKGIYKLRKNGKDVIATLEEIERHDKGRVIFLVFSSGGKRLGLCSAADVIEETYLPNW